MKVRLRHERLAEELAKSPLTMNRWAQRMGLSSGHLSELANGKRLYPTTETRRRLIDGLRLSFDDLFEVELPVDPESADQSETTAAPTRVGFSDSGSGRLQARERLVERLIPWLDLKLAIRSLKRRPMFSLGVAALLGIGVGATVTLFAFVHAALFKSYPYPQAERLVGLRSIIEERGGARSNWSYPEYFDYREQAADTMEVAVWDWEPFSLAGGDRPQRVAGGQVSANFSDVVGAPLLIGQWFTEEQARGDEQLIVLGEGLWRESFGSDPGIVGRTVTVNGEPAVVIGVVDEMLDLPDGARMWVPLRSGLGPRARESRWLKLIGRLEPGVDLADARRQLETVAARLAAEYPDTNEGVGVQVKRLREERVGPIRAGFLSAMAVVMLLLVLVCANAANLLLSRTMARHRELALRSALGASGFSLARQTAIESLLLAGLGLALGLPVLWLGLRAVHVFQPADGLPPWLDLTPDRSVAVFAVAVTLTTALLVGLLPALKAAHSHWRAQRSSQSLDHRSTGRLRSSLVVGQVVLSTVLVCSAALAVKSLLNLSQVDPGFEPRGALLVGMDLLSLRGSEPQERSSVFRQYHDAFSRIPGVEHVGASSHIPLTSSANSMGMTVETPGVESYDPMALQFRSTPGFLRALGLTLLQGRDFESWESAQPVARVAEDAADVASSGPAGGEAPDEMRDERVRDERVRETLVSRSLAERFWPDESPLGQRLKFGFPDDDVPWFTVVGVVADIRHFGLDDRLVSTVYVSDRSDQMTRSWWLLRSSSLDPERLAMAVREAVAEVDPAQPLYNVLPLSAHVGSSLWLQKFLASNLLIFSMVGLLLAAVGLAGVISYSVALRRDEIGVRLTLGAAPFEIASMFTWHGLRLVALGVALGLPLAIVAARASASVLYGVAPWDLGVLVVVVTTLVVAGIGAALWPALRAARLNPVEALATE